MIKHGSVVLSLVIAPMLPACTARDGTATDTPTTGGASGAAPSGGAFSGGTSSGGASSGGTASGGTASGGDGSTSGGAGPGDGLECCILRTLCDTCTCETEVKDLGYAGDEAACARYLETDNYGCTDYTEGDAVVACASGQGVPLDRERFDCMASEITFDCVCALGSTPNLILGSPVIGCDLGVFDPWSVCCVEPSPTASTCWCGAVLCSTDFNGKCTCSANSSSSTGSLQCEGTYTQCCVQAATGDCVCSDFPYDCLETDTPVDSCSVYDATCAGAGIDVGICSPEVITAAREGAGAGATAGTGGGGTGGTTSGGAGGGGTGGTTSGGTAGGGTGGATSGGAAGGGTGGTTAAGAGGTMTGGAGAEGGGAATGGAPPLVCGVRTGACSDTSTSTGMLTNRYGYLRAHVAGDLKTYILRSNWWNSYSEQSVSIEGLSFTIQGATPLVSGGAPAGFPAFSIGNYQGRDTECSNLPKQVSAIVEIPTVFQSNVASMDTSDFSAAYDLWFTASSAPLSADQSSPGAGGVMLMIWLYQPANRRPVGSLWTDTRTVSGVEGTFSVYVDEGANGTAVVSYVSNTPRSEVAFDLKRFIDDAIEGGFGNLTANHYLSVVFGGFEIWGAASGLELSRFCVDVR